MIELQKANVADAPIFVCMEENADTKGFITPNTLNEHLQEMSDEQKIYLRIVSDSVVGFIILTFDSDGISMEFRRIVVADKGNGIGQRAIKLMESFCHTELGRSRIWLDVFEHNKRGRHIYEKLGYSKFGETTHNGNHLLLYEKRFELR